MHPRILVVLLFLIGSSPLLAAPPPKEHPAKADLIADVAAVQPGQPFQVALRITMKPDWHIYWIEPGDSGTATEIKFNAPAGWKVEPLPFPTPHKFTLPGPIVNNGYSGEVLFLAKMTPPADAKGPVELSADAEWLVCNPQTCIPGKGSPKLTLQTSEKAVEDNGELFRKWGEQLPKRLAEVLDQFSAETTAQADQHMAFLTWKQPVQNVEVFTAGGNSLLLKDVKVSGQGQTMNILFTAQPIGKGPKPTDAILLVAYEYPDGVRRSLQFKCPLKR